MRITNALNGCWHESHRGASVIRYRDGYEYQLADTYRLHVSIKPEDAISNEYLTLTSRGRLTIRKGYAWDGPSGPAIDTPNFMRGSLVHDALYQLMREKLLDQKWRDEADSELRRICLEDGMSQIRSWWVHQGVRFGGGPSADPEQDRPVLTAP